MEVFFIYLSIGSFQTFTAQRTDLHVTVRRDVFRANLNFEDIYYTNISYNLLKKIKVWIRIVGPNPDPELKSFHRLHEIFVYYKYVINNVIKTMQ